jgi:hypothetical protein
VLKRYRELDPEAFKPAAPRPTKAAGSEDVRKALLLAERLQSLLEAHDEVSRESRKALKTLVGELKALFEESRKTA